MPRFALACLALLLAATSAEAGIRRYGTFPVPVAGAEAEAPTQGAEPAPRDRASAEERR